MKQKAGPAAEGDTADAACLAGDLAQSVGRRRRKSGRTRPGDRRSGDHSATLRDVRLAIIQQQKCGAAGQGDDRRRYCGNQAVKTVFAVGMHLPLRPSVWPMSELRRELGFVSERRADPRVLEHASLRERSREPAGRR